MPYTIFEQIDCAKKLENGQKPMLYNCSAQESDNIKKEYLESDGNSLSGVVGIGGGVTSLSDINHFLMTNSKVNTSSSVNSFDSISTSNVNLIYNTPTVQYSSSSSTAQVNNTGSNSIVTSSAINGGSQSSQQHHSQSQLVQSSSQPDCATSVAQSSTVLNAALHMNSGGNVVVSNATSGNNSQLVSSNIVQHPDGTITLQSSAGTESMQIRDYLSEIVLPTGNQTSSGNQVVTTDQAGNTVLTNSTFLSPADYQQLVKSGLIIDQSGQALDPNVNGYVYQLQLAPTAEAAKSLDSSKQTSQVFTLGPASVAHTLQQAAPISINTTSPSSGNQQPSSPSPNSRRGRGRPKKYSDPLSLAVEQCLENSNSPTQANTPTVVANATQFTSTLHSSPGTNLHKCRYPGCSFACADILEFRNHNRAQHRDESTIIPPRKGKAANSKEPLVCEVPGCGYSPKYRRLLIDHQNAHKGLRAHKCCFCEYNSSYFGDIRKHMIKKHPDLAQEIKLTKLKLKQNGVEGKNTKLSKQDIDEINQRVSDTTKSSKKAGAANGGTKRKAPAKKSSKKSKKDATAPTQLDQTMASTTTYTTSIQGQDAKTITLPQAGANQAQYGFMTVPANYGVQSTDLNQSGLAQANYGNLMPQAIIYLQTPNGQTVQLAANDMNTLNQIIGYTDINQLAMTSGHTQIQNIGTTFQGQQQTSNGLTSICLDGSGGQTLTFLADPHQMTAAQPGQNAATTISSTIYKCDMPSCYFQSDQYDQVILHKHREHSSHDQQILIDASSLQGQQVTLTPNPSTPVSQQVSQVQQQQQQLVTSSPNVVSSSVYALTPSSSVTSTNFVHTLDYASLTTQAGSQAVLHQQQQQHPGSTVTVSSSSGQMMDVSNGITTSVANMIFTGDPNALYFSTNAVDHQHITQTATIDSNGMMTVTNTSVAPTSSVINVTNGTSSLVTAAAASAGLSESVTTTKQ